MKNIIFLDYDGVINTKIEEFDGYFDNPEAIHYLNKLCKEFHFDIVVTSSWRHHSGYKDFLYHSNSSSNETFLAISLSNSIHSCSRYSTISSCSSFVGKGNIILL